MPVVNGRVDDKTVYVRRDQCESGSLIQSVISS